MNPLIWKKEHQLALIVTCVLGAVLGMLFGFTVSLASFGAPDAVGTWFDAWLQNPDFYWPWPVFGVVIAGLTFYAVRLCRL